MHSHSAVFALRAALATFPLLANCSSSPGSGASIAGGGSGPAGSSGAGSAAGLSAISAGGHAGAAGSSSAGGASGATSSGGASAIEASFKTVKGIIASSCFGAGCHSERGNPLQMEVGDTLYPTLTSHTTRTCGKLLDTARPAQSAIVKLLEGSCNGVPRMPYGVCVDNGDPSCVPPEYIAAILAWIAKGAPEQ